MWRHVSVVFMFVNESQEDGMRHVIYFVFIIVKYAIFKVIHKRQFAVSL